MDERNDNPALGRDLVVLKVGKWLHSYPTLSLPHAETGLKLRETEAWPISEVSEQTSPRARWALRDTSTYHQVPGPRDFVQIILLEHLVMQKNIYISTKIQ